MKGRPILGVISGFMFGLFLGPTLFMWGVIPLHSELMWILPLLGIVLGLVMAWWAPFGRKTSTASAEAMSGSSTPAEIDQTDEA
jgi:hypothetical protein